jgi:hypothetical protein
MFQYGKIFALFILLIAWGSGDFVEVTTENLHDESITQTLDDNQITAITQAQQNDDPIIALTGWLAEISLNLVNSSTCNHTIKDFEQQIRDKLDSAISGVDESKYKSFFENTFNAKDNYELACITSKTLAREMISRIEKLERYLKKSEGQGDKSAGLTITKISFGHMVKNSLKMLLEIQKSQTTAKDQIDTIIQLNGTMMETLKELRETGPPVDIQLEKENLNSFTSFAYIHPQVVVAGKYRVDVEEQITLLNNEVEKISEKKTKNQEMLDSLNTQIQYIQSGKEKLEKDSSENTLERWTPAKQILEQIRENCEKFLS